MEQANSNGSKIHKILNKIRDRLEPHSFPPSPNGLDYDNNKESFINEITKMLSNFYDLIEKKYYNIKMLDVKGNVIFALDNVEAPALWSEKAVRICASKYFLHEKETSVFDMVTRVVMWITLNGIKRGYFSNLDLALEFAHKLAEIIMTQRATFNSPVWFNVGAYGVDTPCQTNACFINELHDDIADILAHNVIKQLIAIGGSGSGADLSVLRSEKELLSTGGKPSGPSGFFRMFDSNLGAIKSSGKTRRAAGLVSIFHDHPDALKFLTLKRDEEIKARVLNEHCEQWEHDFASESIFSHRGLLFQNINASVRFRESFWKAYEEDGEFHPVDRHGNPMPYSIKAREFLKQIAQSAWECGDPGVQYDDNVNKWNPFLESGRRCYSTNACSELQFLNNSACNLSTLKLTAYYNVDKHEFDLVQYGKDIHLMIKAMDILIDDSIYPTKPIAETSWKARNLGLNYADLGGLLFKMGLAYGSEEARYVAAFLASYMTLAAYSESYELAVQLEPFGWLKEDKVAEGMKRVIKQHVNAVDELCCVSMSRGNNGLFYTKLHNKVFPDCSIQELYRLWCGFTLIDNIFNCLRNSQVTIMVPTGTVSFMLDCDTTGIESYLSHQFDKDLVGGGSIEFKTSDEKLSIGHSRFLKNRKDGYLKDYNSKDAAMKFYATALGNGIKDSTLTPMDHVDMMAAIQPNISLGISKTCNVPSDCTPEDIEKIYYEGWKRGLKAIAVYRDNSKIAQPLVIKKEVTTGSDPIVPIVEKPVRVSRSRILTLGYRFQVAHEKVYLHVGFDPTTDKVWEIFVKLSGVGGTLDGSMSTTCILTSQMIQKGHIDDAIKTLKRMVFEPNGLIMWPDGEPPVELKDIRKASSIPNAIGRMLEILNETGLKQLLAGENTILQSSNLTYVEPSVIIKSMPAGISYDIVDNSHRCAVCGHPMVKIGMSASCYHCDFCTNSEGSCGG